MTWPNMEHCLLMFRYEDRLNAIREALDYDLTDLSHEEHRLGGAAARLWNANFKAWKLCRSI